jgi:hypothetical protein
MNFLGRVSFHSLEGKWCPKTSRQAAVTFAEGQEKQKLARNLRFSTGLKSMGRRARLGSMLLAIALLVLAAGWRIFTVHVAFLSNFSPVMALAFCAGVYTRDTWLRLVPFVALVLSDLYIDRYYAVVYHYEWSAGGAALRILCFAAALGIGVCVSSRRNWLNLFGGALAGSLLFYLVTNTASWAGDLGYSHDPAGWWQAVTVGHPQYYPTIFFFRNSLVSDLLFTGCFALAMEYASLRKGSASLLDLKQVRR